MPISVSCSQCKHKFSPSTTLKNSAKFEGKINAAFTAVGIGLTQYDEIKLHMMAQAVGSSFELLKKLLTLNTSDAESASSSASRSNADSIVTISMSERGSDASEDTPPFLAKIFLSTLGSEPTLESEQLLIFCSQSCLYRYVFTNSYDTKSEILNPNALTSSANATDASIAGGCWVKFNTYVGSKFSCCSVVPDFSAESFVLTNGRTVKNIINWNDKLPTQDELAVTALALLNRAGKLIGHASLGESLSQSSTPSDDSHTPLLFRGSSLSCWQRHKLTLSAILNLVLLVIICVLAYLYSKALSGHVSSTVPPSYPNITTTTALPIAPCPTSMVANYSNTFPGGYQVDCNELSTMLTYIQTAMNYTFTAPVGHNVTVADYSVQLFRSGSDWGTALFSTFSNIMQCINVTGAEGRALYQQAYGPNPGSLSLSRVAQFLLNQIARRLG